jgi:ribosomal protein S18 acetylase RimI-like enzyme
LDAFPNLDEEPLNALYRSGGYQRMAIHRVMQAKLQPALDASPADPRIARAAPDDLPHWLPLHHALFPSGYLSDGEIEAALDGGRRLVLTASLQGRPAGYLIANDEPAMDEIYVDFIGVDPACRGHGLARALLQEALRWGRGLNRRHAALTVRQDREEALSLYRGCGLEQVSAGVHWRKDR